MFPADRWQLIASDQEESQLEEALAANANVTRLVSTFCQRTRHLTRKAGMWLENAAREVWRGQTHWDTEEKENVKIMTQLYFNF